MRYALVTLLIALVASRADAGRGTASLKYLPDDTNVVVVADVARARNSPIFKKLFTIAREQNTTLDTLASAQPIEKQVDTIVAASTPNKDAVIVLEGRIDKLVAEAKKQATKTDTHAGVTFWVTADGEFTVVDKKLVFASAGQISGVIDRAKDKKAKGPAAVRTIMAATTPNTAVFGGATLDASMKEQFNKSLGAEPQWAAVSFAMAQKLTIDARLKFADETAAATAVKTVNDQLTPDRRGQLEGFVGKDFADSVTIDQQQSFARIAAALTADELDKVISFLKMVL
ncbi:MAG TPA: hypothetical protein VFV99_30400 [Kofleriaceae bacterium]|nr:hypothetical protein [Kofleriaceae bacterium]